MKTALAICALAVQAANLAAVTPVINGDTWTFTVESGTETYSTAISGAVKVVKEGAGTLVLGASANTFTGGIEVNGGTLQGTLAALGGKLDVTQATAAPQPLVAVANGATLSIANTTCDGNYSARLAKELRVAGHGVGDLGAVQRPSGSGSMHGLFDKITLTGDATLSAVQRWGFAPGSTFDMGGHTLKVIGGANFEVYNGAVTVANAGKIELLSGKFLMQGEFAGDIGSIQLDGGTFQLWGRSIPLSWPVAVAANATMLAGAGTSRASNVVAGDIALGAQLTLNIDAANRHATLSGGIDGPGELLVNNSGTLHVTGAVDRVLGKFTQSKGNAVLENAGRFCVTNWTAGAQGFRPTTPAAKVAGAWSAIPRLAVTGNSVFTMPASASGNAAATKKHHLFVGGAASEFGVLEVGSGGVVSNDLNVGRSTGSAGAVYVNDGGKLHWRGGVDNQGWIGDQGCGHLALNEGAAFESEGLITVGAYGNANGNGGVGIVHQKGGTAKFTRSASDIAFSLRLGRDNSSYGLWYQTGGTSTFANHVALCYADSLLNRSNVESVVTLSGEGTAMNIADGRYLESCVSSNAVTGIVNLNDGATLTVRRLFKNYASTAENDATATTANFKTQAIRDAVAASKFYVNFDGGILKPAQHGNLFNNRGGVYDDPDRITVHSGGAIVDTSLCTGGNLNWSVPIRKPSGNVLLSVSLPTDSSWVNSYIAPPRVAISGVNAHGATAAAEFDETTGRLTGITVTSPGSDVPSDISVTIRGGNLSGVFDCPFTVGAPPKDGGLVKRGANTLYLDMADANTYEGPTVVEGGVLQFANRTYPEASPLVLKGGKAVFGGYAYTIPSLEGYGEVAGSGGITITGELRVSCADLFGEGRSIAAQKVTLASVARLVVTDPENLAQYRGEEAAVFLTASAALVGDAPSVDLDPSYGDWRCSKVGNALKFGFPQPFVMVIR